MRNYLACLASVAAIAAASVAPVAAQETIAVFVKNQTNPWFESFRAGAEQATKQQNMEFAYFVPERAENIQDQISQVENAIVRKYDALVFMPVDYKALVPAILQVNAAGIPIVNVSDRLEGGEVAAFVGVPDYEIGLSTAKYLFDAMGGAGSIVIIEGVKGAVTAQERNRGFQDALKDYPGIKVLDSQPGDYQRLKALQVTENLLQSHAQIDGFLTANDAMAVGVIEALEGAGRTSKVIGINGTAEAVDAVKAGKLLATTNSNPFLQGCVSALLAARAIRGEPIVAEYQPALTVVDASNADAASVPDAEKTCPTWEELGL